MQGSQINNERKNQVFDVAGANDNDNAAVNMYPKHGKANQQWEIMYTDNMKKVPGKGEFSDEFGLYVLRPFHIVSQLASKRYLDVLQDQAVIKTPNGFDSQIWFFDYSTKTIKNQGQKTKSIGVHGSTVKIYNTDSKDMQLWKYEREFFTNIKDKRVWDVRGS